MLVFASSRGSQNEQKSIPRPLVILVFFTFKINTLPASILVPLGSLLGLPSRAKGTSKASSKQLLEASWAILAASSIFGLPKGFSVSSNFDVFRTVFDLKMPRLFLLTTLLYKQLCLQLLRMCSFSTSRLCSVDCPFDIFSFE